MNGLITCFVVLYGPAIVFAVAIFWALRNRESKRKAAWNPQPSMRAGVIVRPGADYFPWMLRDQTG